MMGPSLSVYFIRTVLLGLLAAGLGLPAAQAQRPTLDQIARGHDSASGEEHAQEPLKTPLFALQKPAIKRFCNSLELDQRREEFLAAATTVSEQATQCRACGPLGRMFVSSCSAAKVSKKIPAPSYGKKQREPHPLVIDSASAFIVPLSSDKETAPETARFVQLLVTSLLKGETLSPGAKEYYSTLASMMERPFKKYLPNRQPGQLVASHDTPSIDPAKREELLNEMF